MDGKHHSMDTLVERVTEWDARLQTLTIWPARAVCSHLAWKGVGQQSVPISLQKYPSAACQSFTLPPGRTICSMAKQN